MQLSAASQQWVNLASSTGVASFGTNFTTVIGDGLYYGLRVGTSNAQNAAGYSFEVVVKATTATTSKVFEIGNGMQTQEIVLSMNSGAFTFNVYRSDASAMTAYTVVPFVTLGQWYHIVVVVQPAATAGQATVVAYVNGVAVNGSTVLFPQAVARTHAQLGKSDWTGEGYFNGFLDRFAVYDYAISLPVAQSLYNLSAFGLPPATTVVIPPTTQYTAGPQVAYTFDTPPPNTTYTQDAYDSTYTWLPQLTAPNSARNQTNTTRTGVATFNGVFQTGDYIDLTLTPDSYGNTLSFPFGGSLSFETWFRYDPAGFVSQSLGSGYQYLWSTAGELGQGNNNLGFTTIAYTTAMMVSDFYGTTTSHVTDSYPNAVLVVAKPGQWQHAIVSIAQLTPGNLGATGANCSLWFNGQLTWSQICSVPQWVLRPSAFLGRSNDDANSRSNIAIDSFYLYNYALSPEAIRLHYVVPRAPFHELVFDQHPATFTNQTTTNYGWLSTYNAHSGVLQLSATAGSGWGTAAATGQWVHLGQAAGVNSIGAAMTGLVGGTGVGVTGVQLGWTIELIFQVTSVLAAPNMVLLDLATTAVGVDEIILQFVPGSCALQLTVYGGTAGTTPTNMTVHPCVANGVWYHLVISATTSTYTPLRATYRAYVNSVLTAVLNGNAPRQTPRINAFLGRSLADASAATATLPFNGLIDALRIFDFAAVQDDVIKMFGVTSSDATNVPAPLALYSSAPQNQWTFDTAATATAVQQGSFVWESGRGSHFGLAYLRSSTRSTVLTTANQVNLTVDNGDYVNLISYPDAVGRTMPLVWGGGPATFESWVEYSSWQPWSRILDIGNCAGCDNMAITENGNSADSPILSFHSVNGGNTTNPLTTAAPGLVTDCDMNNGGANNGPLSLNQWLHIACTYQARDPADLASSLAADLTCWVNGVQQLVYSTNYATPPLATAYTTPGAFPNLVTRSLALLGQSNYAGNLNFNGWIDSVYWSVKQRSMHT